MSLYLIKPIVKKPTSPTTANSLNESNIKAEINLLEHFDLHKTFNDLCSKHLSSTYKSYVKNLPGDNYIKREKHKHSSNGPVNPNDPQQQQQQPPPPQQQPPIEKVGGLTKLVEGNYPDDNQEELILLSLGESQLKAFQLQDGGYIRPDKDKKKKKHKKKRKHRDGTAAGENDEERKKKKKSRKEGSNEDQNVNVV
ncbi:hypothetical protein CYY_001751 [Polysphondylium violaceum]|uniref:Uncharacterized protein n=1 Tax=Polysphondylium violaceum TaxID=133409 RepID=A0A8J4PZ86_9MYCE|nr:hypothetical protein CYY_001751 [Polysphondylium violaceum]